MYSLKKKLSHSLLVNMVVIMLLLMVGLNFMILNLLKDHVMTRLQHDAESLISLVQREGRSGWTIDPAHMSTIYNRVRSGHYYQVDIPGTEIRSRSLFDFEFDIPYIDHDESLSYQMDGIGNEDWLVWQQRVIKNGVPVNVWVAEDISPLFSSILRFSGYALAGVILLTVLSLLVQQRIIERAFRIFDEIRVNLKTLGQQDTDLPRDRMPSEVWPLVNEISLLVEHLGQRTRRTRNAIANLSHELKRPLQILSLATAKGESDTATVSAVENIKEVIERELRRARLSGSDRLGGEFRIVDELPFLVELMSRIYAQVEIETRLSGDLDVLHLDRDDMLELLGNLMDNACKFSSGQVVLEVACDDGQLNIRFDDNGNGVEEAQMSSLTKKGFRLDENAEGHGLGLNICAEIVATFSGQLTFSVSPLGGLRVDVILPLHR